ncbi:MAG: hypothetical protein FWF80_04995 [Defluviitaleaceae bacterium]|nr:hypothetical protein [Defluviitaleaceae bacterium]
MKHIFVALLVFVTLLQGGFSDAVWSLCGIIAVLFLLFRAKKLPPMPVVMLLLSLVAVYAVSAVVHGLPFESLAVTGRIMVAVLLLFAFYNIDSDITDAIFITGMMVAGIGFAALSGLFHWDGAVVSNRLQSVFQYANAAGFFIGISAFLARTKRSPYAPFLETALILTQSVGAIAVYGAGWAIYLAKNRDVKLQPVLCGFAVSAFAAGIVFAILIFSPVPQLSLLPPIFLLVFRKKFPPWIDAMAQQKWFGFLGGGVCVLAISSVFFVRGFRPVATYLERLIHIWDGFGVISRYPLGIGPGAWEFELFAHQSSLYSAARIHSEYIAVGVDAGFLAFILLLAIVFYCLKNMRWSDKSVCVIMALLAATMDIPFSFLSVTMVTVWLISSTLQKSQKIPKAARVLFLLPLALFAVVFAQSAMKNHAAWVALSDPIGAAEILAVLPIRNDSDAALTRISIYLSEGRHDLLDEVFETMPRPNTVAHAQRTRSLIRRGLYEEAAYSAIAAIESGPHRRVTAEGLLEQILPYIDEVRALEIGQKADALIPEINPLRIYIQLIKGEDEP